MPDITIGRLRGGFCVSWHEGGRRRRYQLAARDRKSAEAEARDVYLHHTARQTVLTVADIWANHVAALDGRPTGVTMGYTGKAVLAHFGALRPDQITPADCRAYTATRIAAGRKVGSVHTELGHLRSALRWAEKMRLIDRAPYIDMPPKPDSDVRPLEPPEVARLIDGCLSPHVRLAVVLLATTAARIGAILDLEWDRVDFERGTINYRLPGSVRRKGRAVVPMNRMARAALQSAHAARLSGHVIEDGGKPIKSIRTGFSAAVRRAGLPHVTIHQIRHTAAVTMLASGVPMQTISQMLGHSSIQTTQRVYARYSPEHLADAADVLVFGRFSEPGRTSLKGRNGQ